MCVACFLPCHLKVTDKIFVVSYEKKKRPEKKSTAAPTKDTPFVEMDLMDDDAETA